MVWFVCLSHFTCFFLHLCVFLHMNVERFSMEKKGYKNRIRVILVEKMITNTYLAEQLGMSKISISWWYANTTSQAHHN